MTDRSHDAYAEEGDTPQPGTETGEVGSEGGSPGDIEIDTPAPAAGGSEAGETYRRPERVRRDDIHRPKGNP